MDALLHETIAATASAPGPALRAVIRISGPETKQILARSFDPDSHSNWDTGRTATRHPGRLRLSGLNTNLPVHVLHWPNARSYTGQPAAEIHMIGSPPLVEAALEQLFAHGARPARAGEFTLRAFLAGRIDLLQAEAVLGVIDAPDDVQLRSALAQLAGGVSGKLSQIHEQLLLDLADLEAGLDFVEEDIDFVSRNEFTARLNAAAEYLQHLLDQARHRWHRPAGPKVVIAGQPNAGKSTLFNRLLQERAAITSDRPGTTRDYLRAPLELNGLSIELIDTAGREEIENRLDRAAQQASENVIHSADLVLWCSASDAPPQSRTQDEQHLAALAGAGQPYLHITTKRDIRPVDSSIPSLAVSSLTGAGVDELLSAVRDRLESTPSIGQELIGSTAARCRDSLHGALQALDRARSLAAHAAGDELIALEIREALEQTGRIAGRVYTDDLLDRIFSRFCIGK